MAGSCSIPPAKVCVNRNDSSLDITISDANTGEILRQLTLDTTRRYQPLT